MNSYKVLGLICLIMAMVASSPVPADNYVFADLIQNAKLAPSSKESIVVKRRIFENNPEAELKQISLRSLVGDFEKSIFASALSVNKVLNDKNADIPEIEENYYSDINIPTKGEATTELTTATPTVTTAAESPVPTHIVIDRIAIQPHTGGISLIPIFEIKRTTKDENDSKDREITKITISKTEITSLTTAFPESSTNFPSTTSTTSTTTTSKSAETILESATTPKNIEQLKEAEEELKEKVAEIEAEPIILSARV